MGEQKRRKAQFFQKHPYCCFCGGGRLATTEDHQPGRIFFKNREWPEGFVFPACEPCNAVSRSSERVLGVLVHGHAEDDDRARYRKNLESVRRELPEVIESLIPSSIETRAILKQRGLTKPAGFTFGEVPMIKMESRFWKPHFDMLARKLLLALHYQCFGTPLPRSGGMWNYFHTNVDLAAGEFPPEIIEMAERVALPTRHKRVLGDQFSIRWNFTTEGQTGIFVTHFHKKIVISGITTETPEAFGSDRDQMLRPFCWE